MGTQSFYLSSPPCVSCLSVGLGSQRGLGGLPRANSQFRQEVGGRAPSHILPFPSKQQGSIAVSPGELCVVLLGHVAIPSCKKAGKKREKYLMTGLGQRSENCFFFSWKWLKYKYIVFPLNTLSVTYKSQLLTSASVGWQQPCVSVCCCAPVKVFTCLHTLERLTASTCEYYLNFLQKFKIMLKISFLELERWFLG